MDIDEKLDISDMVKCAKNFERVIAHAAEIEKKCLADSAGKDSADNEDDDLFEYRFARSAVIQVFEITVESAWKIMQRWVKINADNSIAQKPKRELFRTARDSGLIVDAGNWWTFYDGRNKTSHTYHEDIAEEIYQLAKQFGLHLKDFLDRLEERI